VALALVAQANDADAELVALLILPVVLVIGLSSLARIGSLDREDMRWVQGLNRLRSLRLELDPDLAPSLVTSAHDDFDSVLEAYGADRSAGDAGTLALVAAGLSTLFALVLFVNAMLAGFVAGLVAGYLGAEGWMPVAIGIAGASLLVILVGLSVYREARAGSAHLHAIVPSPAALHARAETSHRGSASATPPERPTERPTE
jgi:hypothetical protein